MEMWCLTLRLLCGSAPLRESSGGRAARSAVRLVHAARLYYYGRPLAKEIRGQKLEVSPTREVRGKRSVERQDSPNAWQDYLALSYYVAAR